MTVSLKLSSPVTDVPRVGPKKAQFLAKLGITHARDFLYTFPRRYDDFSQITPIQDLEEGKQLTVRGKVKSVKEQWGYQGRRRLLRIFVDIEDQTGVLAVTWFNLRFLSRQLWQGRELFVAGKVERDKQRRLRMRSPVIEFVTDDPTHAGRITPVYPETYGVSSRFLRHQVKTLLPLIEVVPEYLPDGIRQRNQLMGIHQAITAVHFPEATDDIEAAQRRLRFDELFFLQLAALVRRQLRAAQQAPGVPSSLTVAVFQHTIPFVLTKAQQVAMEEIAADLATSEPMNRLLQGDVGSGKSVVALYATKLVLEAGKTVLYLAPTEILARQQAASFAEQLGSDNVSLLVSATSAPEKKTLKAALQTGQGRCVVGTHALLQDDVVVKNLALAIVDEQHRFGVAQRKALQEATPDKTVPHLLSMTATPIPRTLNLTVYGDLDVSVLNEMPAGRKPIKTEVVAPGDRDTAVTHILEELHAGRQAYVIAPLVDESDKLEAKSAKETFVEMQQLFPDIAIGLLHGKMTSEEKTAALNNFSAGALQLLVATAVVEVGVNVPNATIMIIEGAERFGLAQLHQFRGRIGRGEHQSYCYLFPTKEEDANARRLQVLAETTDGFKIAEEDLKLRGPGEVYGVAQSGFGDLQVASLLDYEMIKLARSEAETLLQKDPNLEAHPLLQGKVQQKNRVTHFE